MRRTVHLDRLALPAQVAGIGLQHAIDDLDQGGLAGAVLAEQGVDLARPDVEIDPGIGETAGELLDDAAKMQQRRASSGAVPHFLSRRFLHPCPQFRRRAIAPPRFPVVQPAHSL